MMNCVLKPWWLLSVAFPLHISAFQTSRMSFPNNLVTSAPTRISKGRLSLLSKPPFIGAALTKEEDLQRTIQIIMNHVDDLAKKESRDVVRSSVSEIKENQSNSIAPKNVVANQNRVSHSSHHTVSNGVERALSQLTALFPFFVLSAAMVGFKYPQTLLWVNQGQRVPQMLAAVMMAMGCSLTTDDFKRVLNTSGSNQSKNKKGDPSDDTNTTNIASIPAGILCQYIVSFRKCSVIRLISYYLDQDLF